MSQLRLLCLLLAGALAGCQHSVVLPAAEGTSSARFVERPPPSKSKAGIAGAAEKPTEQIINAQPLLPLAQAIYPRAALAAHLPTVTVGLRIVVDADGRVGEVGLSLASLTLPTPFEAEFRAAAEDAVRQWHFRPAEIRHLESVKADGGDYQRMTSREQTAWAFDVEFMFEASGSVVTGLQK